MDPPALGKRIRSGRRALGLSQWALADMLGISQARISRWEGGREEIPKKHRLKLIDVLFNKRGHIDPLIERLVKLDPSVIVGTEANAQILMMGDAVLRAYRLNRSEIEGREHAEVFDSEWKSKIDYDLSSFCYAEYRRDIELAGRPEGKPGFRCQASIVHVELAGHDRLVIIRNRFLGPSLGAYDIQVHEFLTPSDIET